MSDALTAVYRREGPRILAGLIRRFGDFQLAEDALQEALSRAATRWPRDGAPERPAAWLTTVAQRCALDHLRQRSQYTTVAIDDLADDEHPAAPGSGANALDTWGDDRLQLLFTCCHPSLAPVAQVTLALRTLCGLSTREIARAFVEGEATTGQRLSRAKRKILEARIPFEVPERPEWPERLNSVLGVIYLLFNEGYAASHAADLLRPDLSAEAIRLGHMLRELLPAEPEVLGLLALMLLHDARREARVDAAGDIVPLEEQARSRWNQEAIREGLDHLDTAIARRQPGPYQIQAAIAALHAQAATPAETDWRGIAALYHALLRWTPSPVVELNGAVALGMAAGPERGLAGILELEQRGELARYHLLPAAKADFLRRLGRYAEARQAYQQAIELAGNAAEQRYLRRRLAALPQE